VDLLQNLTEKKKEKDQLRGKNYAGCVVPRRKLRRNGLTLRGGGGLRGNAPAKDKGKTQKSTLGGFKCLGGKILGGSGLEKKTFLRGGRGSEKKGDGMSTKPVGTGGIRKKTKGEAKRGG